MEQLLERQSPSLEQRKRDDVTTLMAEMVNGNMRTSFEFDYRDGELYGQDGLAWSPLFDDAIEHTKQLIEEDPTLAFELRRNYIEREERGDVLAMARGEGPNTMVVESDFPQELLDATEDVGGYNLQRKQAMLRVIYRRPDGKIIMLSQTLEGSDRKGLEAIREVLGFTTEPGELLGQRMKFDLDPEQQEFIIDQLVGVYDRALEQKYGGNYRAGWRLDTRRAHLNTYDFVRRQQDLLTAYLQRTDSDAKTTYALAAAMEQRFERMLKTVLPSSAEAAQQVTQYNTPEQEMYYAAQAALFYGKKFSGCGLTLGGSNELSITDQFFELGYNRLTQKDQQNDGEEDQYGPLTFECPDGHTNKRPRGVLLDRCQRNACKASVKC